MTMHVLKCHAQYFDAVVSGEKCFEVRKDDRDYEIGDELLLIRTDENGKRTLPTQEIVKKVHYILEGGSFGVLHGYVVMGLLPSHTLDNFTDDEIEAEYGKRFGAQEDEIARIYSLLADGEVNDAMDEMSRTFDLLPPHHAKSISARVARGRQGVFDV